MTMAVLEAAVMVVLRDGADGREVLLIRRKERAGDPWSGQIALPGGRADPEDLDRRATALRETEEEVGIPPTALVGVPEFVGTHRPGNRLDLEVSAFVARLRPGADSLVAAGPEVQSTLWVLFPGLTTVHEIVDLPGGRGRLGVDGYRRGEVFIWGLTYRILSDLMARGFATQPAGLGPAPPE